MPVDSDLPIVEVISSVDVTTDAQHVLISGYLENSTSFRLPMTAEAAMRLLALLAKAQEDHGWPTPSLAVDVDRMQ